MYLGNGKPDTETCCRDNENVGFSEGFRRDHISFLQPKKLLKVTGMKVKLMERIFSERKQQAGREFFAKSAILIYSVSPRFGFLHLKKKKNYRFIFFHRNASLPALETTAQCKQKTGKSDTRKRKAKARRKRKFKLQTYKFQVLWICN